MSYKSYFVAFINFEYDHVLMCYFEYEKRSYSRVCFATCGDVLGFQGDMGINISDNMFTYFCFSCMILLDVTSSGILYLVKLCIVTKLQSSVFLKEENYMRPSNFLIRFQSSTCSDRAT